MSEQQIIAVVGATGAQGGGLVRAILDGRGGRFAARALTRNPGSARARELAALGAEVVRSGPSSTTRAACARRSTAPVPSPRVVASG
ncbi:NmrA family NAD(P)-binding protein [Nonomuraea sp. NPDC048892]|uniref:NmrA family NAD(P)-binding protein n=1 Tax=Nonomuraea sp. NPDC048892 TaxID=3154624 RepID=UPI000A46B3B8